MLDEMLVTLETVYEMLIQHFAVKRYLGNSPGYTEANISELVHQET